MLGESGPVQLGSCLHPTPHPTPGFTIFSQWLVPVLFSYVFSRDIWSQEPGITRCGSCVPPNLQIFLGAGWLCVELGMSYCWASLTQQSYSENRKSFFFFSFPLWFIKDPEWFPARHSSTFCLPILCMFASDNPKLPILPSPRQPQVCRVFVSQIHSFVLYFRVLLIVTSGPCCSGHMRVAQSCPKGEVCPKAIKDTGFALGRGGFSSLSGAKMSGLWGVQTPGDS